MSEYTNQIQAGLIARFKPLHRGGALMLEHALQHYAHLTIGIGSANKYNALTVFFKAQPHSLFGYQQAHHIIK